MKKWITVGLTFLFVGLGLMCLGLFLPGGLQSSNSYVQEKMTYSDKLTEIRLNGGSAAVSVIQSDTSEVVIETDTPQSQPFSFREQDGKLHITRTDLRKWYQFVGIFDLYRPPYNIRITLPEGFTGSITLETASGSIQISEVTIGGAMHISTGSGNLHGNCLQTSGFSFTASSGGATVTELTCTGNGFMRTHSGMLKLSDSVLHGTLELSTSSGSQHLEQITATGSLITSRSSGSLTARSITCPCISARATSGNLLMENAVTDGDVLLEQTSGGITVRSLRCRSLSAESQSGKIQLTDLESESVELQASSGSVTLREALLSGPVTVRTSSGNVNCSLKNAASDFTISTKTSSGTLHIPPDCGNGAYPMQVTTSSGSITIRFAS